MDANGFGADEIVPRRDKIVRARDGKGTPPPCGYVDNYPLSL